MSNDSESKTEQQEEMVDLFAEGVDDKALLGEEAEETSDIKQAPATDATEEDELPAKYRGKSIKDVIEMHVNAERAMGRTNNELGELRKLTDQILQQQLGEDKAAERKRLDSDTLLDDPDTAIDGAVSANPKVRELEARLTARERADNLAAFNRQHPNAGALVNDPAFLAWVDSSPTRKRLLQQADQTFDYELASEILTTYESLHPRDENAEQERQENKRTMSNAKPNAASAGQGKKKRVYKRSDLMRLRTQDPDRYEKLQPEILAAYAEGRVR